jgi:CHASE3 domain sensor protein
MKQHRKKREHLIQEIDRMIEENQQEIDRAEQKKSNRIMFWLAVVNAIIFTVIVLGDFK